MPKSPEGAFNPNFGFGEGEIERDLDAMKVERQELESRIEKDKRKLEQLESAINDELAKRGEIN